MSCWQHRPYSQREFFVFNSTFAFTQNPKAYNYASIETYEFKKFTIISFVAKGNNILNDVPLLRLFKEIVQRQVLINSLNMHSMMAQIISYASVYKLGI